MSKVGSHIRLNPHVTGEHGNTTVSTCVVFIHTHNLTRRVYCCFCKQNLTLIALSQSAQNISSLSHRLQHCHEHSLALCDLQSISFCVHVSAMHKEAHKEETRVAIDQQVC